MFSNQHAYYSLSLPVRACLNWLAASRELRSSGLLRLWPEQLARELGMDDGQCREALAELARRRLCHYERGLPVFWLPHLASGPDPDCLKFLPDCPLCRRALRHAGSLGKSADVEALLPDASFGQRDRADLAVSRHDASLATIQELNTVRAAGEAARRQERAFGTARHGTQSPTAMPCCECGVPLPRHVTRRAGIRGQRPGRRLFRYINNLINNTTRAEEEDINNLININARAEEELIKNIKNNSSSSRQSPEETRQAGPARGLASPSSSSSSISASSGSSFPLSSSSCASHTASGFTDFSDASASPVSSSSNSSSISTFSNSCAQLSPDSGVNHGTGDDRLQKAAKRAIRGKKLLAGSNGCGLGKAGLKGQVKSGAAGKRRCQPGLGRLRAGELPCLNEALEVSGSFSGAVNGNGLAISGGSLEEAGPERGKEGIEAGELAQALREEPRKAAAAENCPGKAALDAGHGIRTLEELSFCGQGDEARASPAPPGPEAYRRAGRPCYFRNCRGEDEWISAEAVEFWSLAFPELDMERELAGISVWLRGHYADPLRSGPLPGRQYMENYIANCLKLASRRQEKKRGRQKKRPQPEQAAQKLDELLMRTLAASTAFQEKLGASQG